MHYKCANCRRQFEFDDFIEFCPYCGKMFDVFSDSSMAQTSGSDVVQVIDSIWGDRARLKTEFLDVIAQCVCLINSYADCSILKILPKNSLSEYEKNYAIIKQSNNRKTLINRIDNFIDALDLVIDNLNDRIPADTFKKLESVVFDVNEMKKELYDFLGIRNTSVTEDLFSDKNYSAEVLYSKAQLRDLYNLVFISYSKYKKCVADNNMFAAFSSTSDYGMLPDNWRRWLSDMTRVENNEENAENNEKPVYEKVIAFMKESNAQKYFGLIDEDFLPHVDAFWYGLQMLCEFTDCHITVEFRKDFFCISDEENSKLQRAIATQVFNVNELRLDKAFELKKRFENKLEKLNENRNGEI